MFSQLISQRIHYIPVWCAQVLEVHFFWEIGRRWFILSWETVEEQCTSKEELRQPQSVCSSPRASLTLPYPSPALLLSLLHSLQSRGQTPEIETKKKWDYANSRRNKYEMSTYPVQRFINRTENRSLCTSLRALQGRRQDCLRLAIRFF